jgi:poly-gamma-glutamate synthesis protein (capsule biosynthesis protein)
MSSKKSGRGRSPLVSALVLAALCVALGAVILLRVSSVKELPAVPAAAVTRDTPAPASAGASFTPDPTATAAQSTDVPTASPEPTPEPEPEYFTISMVGDCSMASNPDKKGWAIAYESVLKGDMSYPFANTKDYFTGDYLTIANMEGNLSDNYYSSIEWFTFLSPSKYAEILTEGGVDFVTLANNHTMDFGQNAYNDTCLSLDRAGVAYAGEDETYIYQTGSGLKVGIYCIYNRLTGNSLGLLSADQQERQVAESKAMIAAGLQKLREQGAEYAVACLHMGTEGSYETSQVQVDVCRSTIDAGYDLVYCTHGHRLQPMEEYSGGMIFYGLGNWTFGGHTNPGNGTDPAAYDTIIARVTVCRKGGSITLDSVEVVPCSISSSVDPETGALNANSLNNYQPTPYSEGGAAWERTMSILRGEYAGSNFVPNYGDILSAMHG